MAGEGERVEGMVHREGREGRGRRVKRDSGGGQWRRGNGGMDRILGT
jgi:hypothetical protein